MSIELTQLLFQSQPSLIQCENGHAVVFRIGPRIRYVDALFAGPRTIGQISHVARGARFTKLQPCLYFTDSGALFMVTEVQKALDGANRNISFILLKELDCANESIEIQ